MRGGNVHSAWKFVYRTIFVDPFATAAEAVGRYLTEWQELCKTLQLPWLSESGLERRVSLPCLLAWCMLVLTGRTVNVDVQMRVVRLLTCIANSVATRGATFVSGALTFPTSECGHLNVAVVRALVFPSLSDDAVEDVMRRWGLELSDGQSLPLVLAAVAIRATSVRKSTPEEASQVHTFVGDAIKSACAHFREVHRDGANLLEEMPKHGLHNFSGRKGKSSTRDPLRVQADKVLTPLTDFNVVALQSDVSKL